MSETPRGNGLRQGFGQSRTTGNDQVQRNPSGRLRLADLAGLDGFSGDPDSLDLTAGQADADTLEVGAKRAFHDLGHVRADTATLFGEAFAVNAPTADGSFAGNGADSGHGSLRIGWKRNSVDSRYRLARQILVRP